MPRHDDVLHPRAPRTYRLLRRLGGGGMADVFEAVATAESGFERAVAVKLIRRGTDDAFRRLFLREARIVSRLHHSGIVGVHDFGTLPDGEPFLVMERVVGVDAAEALRELGPFPSALAAYVVAAAARALDHAHRATDEGVPLRIVHRDVSPSNLLLSWEGDVKVADFGVATWARSDETTAEGDVRGKVAYMAPEQFTAQPLDPAADVHALGATLHALVTGRSPIRGVEGMVSRLSGGPLDLASDLNPSIGELVRESMRIDPSRRIACLELAERAERLAAEGAGGPRELARFLAPLRERVGPETAREDGRTLTTTPATAVGRISARADPPTGIAATVDASTLDVAKPSGAVPTTAAGGRRRVAIVALVAFASIAGAFVAAMRHEHEGSNEARSAVPEPAIAPDAREAASDGARPAASDGARPAASEPALVAHDEHDALVPADHARDRALHTDPEEDGAETSAVVRASPRTRPMSSTADERAGPRERAPEEAPRAPATADPAPVAAGFGSGWIRVPARSASEIGLSVFVDGRAAGFVPTQLELTVGSHEVELRAPDGAVVRRARIDVEPRHTRAQSAAFP